MELPCKQVTQKHSYQTHETNTAQVFLLSLFTRTLILMYLLCPLPLACCKLSKATDLIDSLAQHLAHKLKERQVVFLDVGRG